MPPKWTSVAHAPHEHPDIPGAMLLGTEYGYGSLYAMPHDTGAAGAAGHSRLEKSDLSLDQRRAYEAVLKWMEEEGKPTRWGRAPHLSLGGYAGSGKSTVVTVLAKELNPSRLAFTAFTGKASAVLRSKLAAAGVVPDSCGTLHSLLYTPIEDADTGEVSEWRKRGRDDVEHLKLIVLDEASMVNQELWDDLLELGIPILAVGDHGQLPPIGNDIFNPISEPVLRLEQVHRQAADNPIIKLATAIRKGQPWQSMDFGADDRVRYLWDRGAMERDIIPAIFPDAAAAMRNVVLCRYNRTRQEVNRRVTEQLHGTANPAPYDGAPVICLRNVRVGVGSVYNGQRGRWFGEPEAWGADHYGGTVVYDEDGLALAGRFCASQFGVEKTFQSFDDAKRSGFKGEVDNWRHVGLQFDHGGALTVHKSQGSQFDRVLVIEEVFRGEDEELHRKWLYTAVTRAAEGVLIAPAGRPVRSSGQVSLF
jgi:exodeoxyribonuclease-5